LFHGEPGQLDLVVIKDKIGFRMCAGKFLLADIVGF
jgi:hypothetical protein